MLQNPAITPPDPAALTRRERRKLEVRSRIFEAALSLVDEQGFHATKVTEICARADVAEKTFFNHFSTKRALLGEIARFALGEVVGHVELARHHPGSTADRVVRLFEIIADRSMEVGPMRRELVAELVSLAHEEGTEEEQARLLHDAFGALVRDGLERGDVRTDHTPETLIELLLGAFYVQMFNWTNFESYPLREHAVASARLVGEAIAARER